MYGGAADRLHQKEPGATCVAVQCSRVGIRSAAMLMFGPDDREVECLECVWEFDLGLHV